jgi:hypothetical protein
MQCDQKSGIRLWRVDFCRHLGNRFGRNIIVIRMDQNCGPPNAPPSLTAMGLPSGPRRIPHLLLHGTDARQPKEKNPGRAEFFNRRRS